MVRRTNVEYWSVRFNSFFGIHLPSSARRLADLAAASCARLDSHRWTIRIREHIDSIWTRFRRESTSASRGVCLMMEPETTTGGSISHVGGSRLDGEAESWTESWRMERYSIVEPMIGASSKAVSPPSSGHDLGSDCQVSNC